MDLSKLATIHDRIAADLPPLSHLVCDQCRAREELAAGTVANYLRSGWPVCCGYTMRLVTAREAAAAPPPAGSAGGG